MAAKPSPKKPYDRVTVRDIADEVGMHFTTVAEALRNSRRIRKETREKVRAVASRLGYRPDPILSALNAYRTRKQRRVFQGLLAWVHTHPERDAFQKGRGFYHECWTGAMERAEYYGFQLEDCWLGERDLTISRAIQILKTRNTLGLLLAPQALGVDHLDLPWEQFCAVRIGYSLRDLALPMVGPDQFHNTIQLYHALREKGFQRIGLACPHAVDERVGHGYSGGYLTGRLLYGKATDNVPAFLDAKQQGDPKAFLRWFERHRPEVIMLIPGQVYYSALRESGCCIPEDISVALLNTSNDGTGPITHPVGIDENGRQVGETAVDILVGVINRNAFGLPPYFRKTLIGGAFVDGSTCRAPGKKPPRKISRSKTAAA